MVVQSELGKGLAMLTNPHYTPNILQSSSSQPQKTHKPRNPTRKVTQVPQPSDPMKHVANKVIHKELGDSLVRATTTAFSLEAEKDSGNINKTQSKETPNMRIDAIDQDEDITLVNVQDDAEMFDVADIGGEEVFVVEQEVVSTVAITVTMEELTLAQALEALNTLKPKEKIDDDLQLAERLQAQEQEELSDAEKATLLVQLLERKRKRFEAKREEEKRNKPPTQAQNKKIMCTYLKNLEGYTLKQLKLKEFDEIQEMFDRAFKRVNTFEDFRSELVEGKQKRAGEELIQESVKK
nr:hypothetical protein [Tanacetum cinerariifolium]